MIAPRRRLDLPALAADVIGVIERTPEARAKWSADGQTLRFRAWWRGDRSPSAYVKPAGGRDGLAVWGDSGTGEKGGIISLARKLGLAPHRTYPSSHLSAWRR